MKNKSLFLILLLALIAPWAAQAQETLTVCDGTTTNEFLPVYGFYMDTQGTTSEFIIPANTEGMSGMVGGTISKLTFYISGSPASWGNPTIQLYLGEVEGTTLSSVNGPSNFTVVKTMVWSNQQSTIEVEFDVPYTYGGGNLLIGTYVQSSGTYKSTSFYGVTAPSGSGYCTYPSWGGITENPQGFIPKTTFTYEAVNTDCPKPNNLVASNVTPHTADLSWESDGFEFVLQYKKASQSSWNEEWLYPEDNPIPYTLTNLAAETEYQARVAAIHETCPTDPETGDHVQSDWREITFTTGIACFAPTNLAVTPESVTPREATVTWEGSSDSYVVMIGEENLAVRADFETGDLSQAGFTSTSDYPWTVVANTHSGAYCAKSGNGDVNYSTSELLLEVNLSTDMTLTFSAKVSSESDWDKAYFSIDGVTKINEISGNGNWIDYSYPLTAGNHTLSWRYTKDSYGASNDDCFYVDDIVISAGVDSWTEYNANAQTYTFTNLTPNRHYQVKVKGNCGDEGYSQETAPVRFTTLESCFTPTDLTASNVTTHEATISWTSAANAWQICVNDDEEHLIDVTETTYNFTGLTPETAYTVKVRTNCGDEYSDWTNNMDFTTGIACFAPTNLAVTAESVTAHEATVTWEGTSNNYVVMIGEENIAVRADFEDQTIPAAFTNTDVRPWSVTAGGANGSGYCAIPGNHGLDNSDCDLTLEVTLDNPATVSFNAKVSSEDDYDWGRFFIDGTQMMQISGSQDWTAYSYELAAGTHTLIWRYAKDSGVNDNNDLFYVDDIIVSTGVASWTEYDTNALTYTFENLTPNRPYQVKVKGNCGDEGYSQASAPVRFTTLESCVTPTGLAVSNITGHKATISWTSAADDWQICVNDDEEHLIDVTENTYTLTGLTPETAYTVKVRANCGEDGESEWSSIVTFSTPEGYIKTIEAHSGEGEEMSGWYLIASPLAEPISPATVGGMITDDLGSAASAETATYDLYYFDQTGGNNEKEWKNYRQSEFNLVSGTGYLYASKNGTTLTFTGEPYNSEDDKVIQLSNTEDNPDESMRGWNLVGNPYTERAYPRRDFYVMNPAGNDIVTSERNYIEPMEGAFVYAEQNGEELTFYKTEFSTDNKGALSINVMEAANHRGNRLIDRAIVRFGEGNTLSKFQLNPNHTKVYIPQGNKDCAVVYSEGQGEMPLSFRANENGSYTITVNAEGVDMAYLHLIDNKTGNDVDLLAAKVPEPVEGPGVSTLRPGSATASSTTSYTFTARTTDYESRFKLVFAVGPSTPSTGSGTFAFISNGNIIVNGEGTLQVIDMMGRVVLSGDAINRVSTGGMTAGVYVLRLINGEEIRVQKIIIE